MAGALRGSIEFDGHRPSKGFLRRNLGVSHVWSLMPFALSICATAELAPWHVYGCRLPVLALVYCRCCTCSIFVAYPHAVLLMVEVSLR